MTDAALQKLNRLIELARSIPVSEEDREEQRRSFVYGNTKIENDTITRKLVDEQAELLAKERA